MSLESLGGPAALALVATMLPAAASAGTLPVDGCGSGAIADGSFNTIVAALTAASPGDTVLVAPCVYRESIELPPHVVLRSSHGPFQTALLPDDDGDAIVAIGEDLERDAVIEGFTVAKGRHFALTSIGSATIRGNVFYDNEGVFGGAMQVNEGAALVVGNIFFDNYAEGGGGIEIQSSAIEIRGNLFARNRAKHSGNAISMAWPANAPGRPMIRGNLFWRNGGEANTVRCVNGTRARIVDNWFLENSIGTDAPPLQMYSGDNVATGNVIGGNSGGLWLADVFDSIISHNTIVGNGSLDRGGIVFSQRHFTPNDSLSPALILGNIVSNNGPGPQIRFQARDSLTFDQWPILDYNCIWGEGELIGPNVTPGAHDLFTDPMLAAPDLGLYSLRPGSPCIDAGPPLGSDPDGTRLDIGALPLDQCQPVAIEVAPKRRVLTAGERATVRVYIADLIGESSEIEIGAEVLTEGQEPLELEPLRLTVPAGTEQVLTQALPLDLDVGLATLRVTIDGLLAGSTMAALVPDRPGEGLSAIVPSLEQGVKGGER